MKEQQDRARLEIEKRIRETVFQTWSTVAKEFPRLEVRLENEGQITYTPITEFQGSYSIGVEVLIGQNLVKTYTLEVGHGYIENGPTGLVYTADPEQAYQLLRSCYLSDFEARAENAKSLSIDWLTSKEKIVEMLHNLGMTPAGKKIEQKMGMSLQPLRAVLYELGHANREFRDFPRMIEVSCVTDKTMVEIKAMDFFLKLDDQLIAYQMTHEEYPQLKRALDILDYLIAVMDEQAVMVALVQQSENRIEIKEAAIV